MNAFLFSILSYVVSALLVVGICCVIIYLNRHKRRRLAREEAARQLQKARETITSNRKTLGLPEVASGKIHIADGNFDDAERVYVNNPARLLAEQHRLTAELREALQTSFQCSPNWEITVPGYNGSVTIPGCTNLNGPVSDDELSATINALSGGGLNSEELVEGTIHELALNLSCKAADAKETLPQYEENRIYIGAVMQDFGNGKIAIRRGRNEALAEIGEAEKDARKLRADLLDGDFENAFMTDADTIDVPVQGKLTAIIFCATSSVVYE